MCWRSLLIPLLPSIALIKFLERNKAFPIHENLNAGQVSEVVHRIIGNTDITDHLNQLWLTPGQSAGISKDLMKVTPQNTTKVDRQLKPYSAQELDFVALLCTIVKLGYVLGALDIIPPLIDLIEPLRDGRELHLTSIRNEHAYYCCIAQLIPLHTTPLIKYPPLYIAGDSHSLPPGWHTINVKGQERLLQPVLVTGLKIWHLRSESKFYPKANFYNMIATIPKGSEVIFLFGEIDCREGLLISVERCKYKDLEEGICVILDIYMNILGEIVGKYDFKIYIHPVLPVLNETRDVVKLFNKLLEKRVKSNHNLAWLDFFDKLLTPDTLKLKPEFEFDGTHMHPKYISLIEEALNK